MKLAATLVVGLSLSGCFDSIREPEFGDGFEVQIRLDPRAESALREFDESIAVAAYYSGWPKPEFDHLFPLDSRGKFDEIELGESRVELESSGVASVGAPVLSAALRSYLRDGTAEVLVNAFSGRRSQPGNILRCSTISKPLDAVLATRQTIDCELIE